MQENIKLVTVKKTVRQAYRTEPIWQYDVGHVLNLDGFDNLPETFQMHYSHSPMGDAITQIGSNGQVSLPDEFAQTSAPIFAWVYVADNDTGLTKYTIEIPVMRRARITNQEPTPVEQSAIDQAISALNAGVSRAETAAANAESSEDAASASAESAYRSSEAAAGAAESAAGDATAAGRSATTAAESASAAAASAVSASGSATTAGNAATAAQNAANTATQKSGEAVSSANSAAASALSAGNAAQTATQKANDATSAATSAQGSASAASGSATAAGQSATAAAGSAAAAAQTKGEIDDEVDGFQAQITNLSSALTQKQDKPQTPGTAGQVLGLDSNLDPAWMDQTGGDESGLASVIKSTASGEIASFADGADGRQIDSLVVNITPVQDLRGQDAPYPPGGGKNKLPYATKETSTVKGITTVRNSDGSLTFSGEATQAYAIDFVSSFLLPAGTYYFSAYGSNATSAMASAIIYVRDKDHDTTLASYSLANTPGQQQFTIEQDTNIRFYSVMQQGAKPTGTLYPMIRLASETDSTYAPYSNICPISGWTGCEVEQTGANLFDKSTAVANERFNTTGITSANSRSRSDYIPVKPNTVYYFKSVYSLSVMSPVFWYDVNKNYISHETTLSGSGVATSPAGAAFVGINFDPASLDSVAVNYPASDTSYHPYTGTTLPISWQSVAGTVYGGQDEVIGGGLKSTMATANFPTSGWVKQAEYTTTIRFSFNPAGIASAGGTNKDDIYCSQYKVVADQSDTIHCMHRYESIHVFVDKVTFPNLTAWETYLSGLTTLPQVVYPLAEPQTYQLSPNEIQTLLGQNNLWASCGSIESVVYSADTKTYVDDAIPSVPVQDVQVNGASILDNGVANVPMASHDNAGVIKIYRNGTYGLSVNDAGFLKVASASTQQIKSGSSSAIPLSPSTQEYAVYYGLSKLAGEDLKNDTITVGQYPEKSKSAIHTMLNGSVSVTGTTPTITALPGIRYVCGEVATLTVNLPASGIVDIVFESGSTATVLTITPPTGQTVKWANGFDPTALDANTIYEINVADGLGVAVGWT